LEIKGTGFADSFRTGVIDTVRKMSDSKEEVREMDTFKSFVVSFSNSCNGRLFYVFSGEELGFSDVEKIYLFQK